MNVLISSLAFFSVLLGSHVASPQGIDDIIAAAYTDVGEFNQLADLEGSLIRQELDMMLTKEQAQALNLLQNTKANSNDRRLTRKRRKAIRSLNYRWTNNEIPYTIQSGVFQATERNQIQLALDEWNKYTCIKFRPATRNDNNKIHFDNGNGCYSYIGMTRTGSQKIGLAQGCRFKGVVVHEIGHAVGFHHEQNRPDRDNYVRIMKENIPESLYYNFQKYPVSAVDTMEIPYDFTSIMHYSSTAFTSNGKQTIRTIDPKNQDKIGNRKGLSFLDIMMANKMYKCSSHCHQGIQCPKGAFLGKDCECWCPGYPITKCASTGTLPTTTLAPTEKTTKQGCVDKNEYCPDWAEANYCGRSRYVSTFCRKSCNTCDGGEVQSTCKDTSQDCGHWESLGYCTREFVEFMSQNCPKTCNVCGSRNSNSEDTGSGTDDKDNNSSAHVRVSLGLCLMSLITARLVVK